MRTLLSLQAVRMGSTISSPGPTVSAKSSRFLLKLLVLLSVCLMIRDLYVIRNIRTLQIMLNIFRFVVNHFGDNRVKAQSSLSDITEL